MTEPYKRRSPDSAPHRIEAQKQKQPAQYTVIREVIAIAVVGALLAVLFVDSVVGMSDDLTGGPMVPMSFNMAEVDHD